MPLTALRYIAEQWLHDVGLFSRLVAQRPLYAYQLAAARAIVDSVLNRRGLEFAVMFPRQAGKNETQAQVTAYLLNVFQHVRGAQVVHAAPTFKPQAQHARRRLEAVLDSEWTRGRWKRGPEYLVRLGEAAAVFYSAGPHANVLGATASVLLMCDEAQAVEAAEWERKFVPMAVSTNATIVLWGTAWTAHTLLAQRLRQLRALEARDGRQRVFVVQHEAVAAENPAYAEAVRAHVARLGRQHPLVKTQYFNEELEAEGGLFAPERRARMQGAHPPLAAPRPLPARYAFLLDVGGEEQIGEQLSLFTGDPPPGPRPRFDGRRDATALTIVEVDLGTLADPFLSAPTYRAVFRRQWVGAVYGDLYGQLRALIDQWQPVYVAADVTGLGEGLGSLLKHNLRPGMFVGVQFNTAVKSQLGWGFLAVCDTGRWQEWREASAGDGRPAGEASADDEQPLTGGPATEAQVSAAAQRDLQRLFWRQLAHTQYALRPGAGRVMGWGVPDRTPDPETGGFLHDDLVLSAALCARLDTLSWHVPTGPGVILPGADPLEALSTGF